VLLQFTAMRIMKKKKNEKSLVEEGRRGERKHPVRFISCKALGHITYAVDKTISGL